MNIRGVKVSEDTIVEALKKHINFREPVTSFNVWYLHVKKQPGRAGLYVFALDEPDGGEEGRIYNLPEDYKGRGLFSKLNIKEIIKNLQELIGD